MSSLLKIRMQDEGALTEATLGKQGVFFEASENGKFVYLFESKRTLTEAVQTLDSKGVGYEIIEKLPKNSIQSSPVRTTSAQIDVSKTMKGKVSQECFYKIVDPFTLDEELITDWEQVQEKLAAMGALAPSVPQVEQTVYYESNLGRVQVEAVRVREKMVEQVSYEDQLVDEVINAIEPGMVQFDRPGSGLPVRMEKDGQEVGELTVDEIEHEPGDDEVGIMVEEVLVEEVLTEGAIRGTIKGKLVEGAACGQGRLAEVKFKGFMEYTKFEEEDDSSSKVLKDLAHKLGYDFENDDMFAIQLPTGNEILFSETGDVLQWELVNEEWDHVDSGEMDKSIDQSSMEELEEFVKTVEYKVKNEDLIMRLSEATDFSVEGGGASPVYLEAPTDRGDRVFVFGIGEEGTTLGWNLIDPETMEIYREGEMPAPMTEYDFQGLVDYVKQVVSDKELQTITESYGDRPSNELQKKYGEYVFWLEYHDGSEEQVSRMNQLDRELTELGYFGKGYPLDLENPKLNVAKKVFDGLCKEHGIESVKFSESRAFKKVEAVEKKMNHSEYMEKVKHMTDEELMYTALDAKRAANAAHSMGSPNEGYYLDEASYCGMEIQRRCKAGLWNPDTTGFEDEFGQTEVKRMLDRMTESDEWDPSEVSIFSVVRGDGKEYFVRKIDDHHVYLSSDQSDLEKERPFAKAYHTDQLRSQPYYDEMMKFVRGEVEGIGESTISEAKRMTTDETKAIAQEIADLCKELGWKFEVRPDILTITKKFAPNDSDAFSQADGEWYGILSLLPANRPGSTWGTDGSGMGGYSALRNGFFRMNKSGGSKLVLRELAKLQKAGLTEAKKYTGDDLDEAVAIESIEVKDDGTVELTFDPYSVRDAVEDDDEAEELFAGLAIHNDPDATKVVNEVIADQGVEIDTSQRGEFDIKTYTLKLSTRPVGE